jgi:large subunit ribosomal protein L30e
MIDITRQLKLAVKSGKVSFGCAEALEAARSSKAKLIVLASNCPEPTKAEILQRARLSELPVYIYGGTSVDLGDVCERRFLVAALTVHDPGDSEILKVVGTEDVHK